MTRSSLAFAASALLAALPLGAQTAPPPVVGRWDLTVTTREGPAPSWLEVSLSGHNTLVGRFVGVVGSARPISRVHFANGELRFAIPPQWERDTADLRVDGTLAGDRMSGTLTTPGGERQTWTAVRAPHLRRTDPAWGAPIALFNGKDLSGWTAKGDNKWSVVNGILTNAGGGANLVTARTFDDFKLRVEFRYPKESNSGIYLRGRYEVQIEDSPERVEPTAHQVGGVYGFLVPSENASRAPGEWQTYDITLVGRRITVVLNGRAVLTNAVVPGITGGALDSNEGMPGPIYLQGDHGAVEFRTIVLTPGVVPSGAKR